MSRILSRLRAGLDRLTDGLSWVLAFWKVELEGLFPWMARVSARGRPHALLTLGEESSRLLVMGPGANRGSGGATVGMQLPGLGRPDDLAARLNAVVEGRLLQVSMSPSAILVMKFELPSAARRALRQAISYRLLSESPVDPSLLVFDAKSLNLSSASHQVQVEVAVAHREEVERIVEALGTRGVRVNAVGIAPMDDSGLDYVFWRSSNAEASLAQARLHHRLLASACVLALIAFPLTTVAAKWLEVQTRQQIRAVQTPDLRQLDIQARKERAAAQRKDLLVQISGVPPTRFIAEVARYLPADAWVSRLEYGYGKLALGGQAGTPFLALRELRKSSLLAEAKLDGVVSPANPGEPPQVEISVEFQGQPVTSQGVADLGLGDHP